MILLLAANARKDIRDREISLAVTFAGFPFGLVYAVCAREDLPFGLLFSFLPGLISVLLSFLTDGAIGLGDGIIICLLGLYFSPPELVLILSAAFSLSAAYSAVLLFRHHAYGDSFAFVPFLLAGVAVFMILS